MKSTFPLRVLALQCALAAAWLLGAAQVIAADAGSGAETSAITNSDTLQEVIVTAQKREQAINDVPMSISAITGEQLAEKGIDSPADLGKLVSGFRFTEGENGTPVYSIRGVGFNETSLGARPNVPIYVDEVPIAFPIMTGGVALDLERVEVLKGPQGTLFGQSATGGAVNYIAAKPTNTFESAITVGYGRFNDATVEGFVSGPLADTLRVRFAYRAEDSGPWQINETNGQDLGRKNKLDGRLLVDWQPTDQLKIALNLTGSQDKSDPQALQYSGYYYQFPPGVPFLPAAVVNAIQNTPLSTNDRIAGWGPVTPSNDSDLTQISVRADYTFASNTVLTYIGSWADFHRAEYSDPDGLSIQNSQGGTNGTISSTSQELRLAGSAFAQRAHWLVGVNFADSPVDQLDEIQLADNSNSNAICALVGSCSGPFSVLRIVNANNHSNQDFIDKAVFAALDFDFSDSLKGHISARHTRSSDDFTGCSGDVGDGLLATAINATFHSTIAPGGCVTGVFVNGVVTPAPPPIQQDLVESNTSWRTGLDWKLDPNNLLYLNVSKGYKGGSFPDLSAFSPEQYKPVVQESLVATELGAKSTLEEQRLQVDAALFYYSYDNKQVRGSVNTGFPFGILPALVNVPKSTEYGLDLQVAWKPAPGWTASLNATYNKSKITDFNNAYSYNDFSLVTLNFDGESLPNTPEVLANADLQYQWGLSGGYTAFVGGNVTYESATNSGFGENALEAIDAYGLLDLRAGMDSPDRRWRTTVWVNNVTDKYYWINQLRIGDTVTKLTGMPITFGVNFSYRFK